MITRTVKIQLLAFVVIALLGVTYVGASYAGLGQSLFQRHACTINADFPDSGGIFTNAEVTDRGVTVGRVGQLTLLPDGVRVTLNLTDCSNPRIPVNTVAAVADRSAVGEQYVDLRPQTSTGPYLTSGAVLPMQRNSVPVPVQVLLTNLNSLVSSVNTKNLSIMVSELGKAFNGRGPQLQTLLDKGAQLQSAATANLQQTIDLIKQSQPVLQTQIDEGSALASWAHSLNLLSQTLKSSNGDLQRLFSGGGNDLQTITTFVRSVQDNLGMLLANLVIVNGVVVPRINSLRSILYLYPLAIAGGFTVTPGDGTAHFGLVLSNANDPPDCTAGYEGTAKRLPSQTAPAPVNVAAHCASPPPINVRGAQNTPGGDPMYTAGGGTVYPKVDTAAGTASGQTGAAGLPSLVPVGTGNTTSVVLGDHSWLALLTGPLS